MVQIWGHLKKVGPHFFSKGVHEACTVYKTVSCIAILFSQYSYDRLGNFRGLSWASFLFESMPQMTVATVNESLSLNEIK